MLKSSLVIAAMSIATAAHAVPIVPTSYEMPNGTTGTYSYWDDSYDGTGNNQLNFAALAGGTGDLTDGVIAVDNWFVEEPPLGPLHERPDSSP